MPPLVTQTQQASAYCADLVRRDDRDRFLCALFAEPAARSDLMALYAFYGEVARVPAIVSEVLIGHMRLQWWRDRLDAMCRGEGAPEGHLVGKALADAIGRRNLPRAAFDPLLDAFANVLDGVEHRDLAMLESHAEATAGSIVALSLSILGAANEPTAAAGRHVGIAWHLIGSLRAIPYREQAGRMPFPLSWGGGGETGSGWLADCVARLCDVAAGHLVAARRLPGNLPRAALPALLPATLADGYLRRLRRSGFDPYDEGLRAAGAGGVAKLAWNAWRGRF